jgi:hypothetical protein
MCRYIYLLILIDIPHHYVYIVCMLNIDMNFVGANVSVIMFT